MRSFISFHSSSTHQDQEQSRADTLVSISNMHLLLLMHDNIMTLSVRRRRYRLVTCCSGSSRSVACVIRIANGKEAIRHELPCIVDPPENESVNKDNSENDQSEKESGPLVRNDEQHLHQQGPENESSLRKSEGEFLVATADSMMVFLVDYC